ncbi:RNA polymerase sigma factor [Spirosoma spitsbergense]|jgi:RNA polymerase sigma factor (sigma-70 family)|uniref:RNA polymerase sigma factor n=1 Tax=Spirosoma spitsbergense TaxID=431554 RepID=UPI00039A8256|nr:RNA polymerase sigma factor [Spirosoma spitsbergense]
MYKALTDEEAIRQYLPDQSNQCFEILYKRYVGKVYQRCLSMTHDTEKAEDFTHDIFIKVFNKLEAFEQRSSFSTWLYSVSFNYCADQLRIAKRFSTTSLDFNNEWDKADSLDDQLHEETLQLMQQAMTSLSAKERSLLRLKYEDGLSIDEIAQTLDLSPSAVKMRLKRSRDKIQSLCEHHFVN